MGLHENAVYFWSRYLTSTIHEKINNRAIVEKIVSYIIEKERSKNAEHSK